MPGIRGVCVGLTVAACGLLLAAADSWQSVPTDQAARSAIEKLHQQDVAATLAHDPQTLADLFTDDAVLLEPGAAPVIGKSAIFEENKKDRAEHPQMKVLSYKPEI